MILTVLQAAAIAAAVCAVAPTRSNAFVLTKTPTRNFHRAPSPTPAPTVVKPASGRLHAEPPSVPSNADDLFASDGWKNIQADLDRLPVFTCASAEGQPLAYTIETKDETYRVPFFYCDVEDAKAELAKAREGTGLEGIDLVPFPLGAAFKMWAKDEAVLVPSKKAVMQAGAPPGTNPIGQQVPLFACMDIMQETEDGQNVLPLFMVLDEANAAMEQAVELDGGNVDDFEVVSLSLQRAVELLATVPETPAFQFIPPQGSIKHIQDYLSD